MKHIHHIVPKHMGGTDNPENLVELTVEEHAEAHRKLYEEYGRKEDYLAWKGLSGRIGKEEIIREKLVIAGKNGAATCKELKKGTCYDPVLLKQNQIKGGYARSQTNRGKSWWTNGTDFVRSVDQPEGYIRSTAPNNCGAKTKGTFWWNNGISHKRSSESPGEGWSRGRIKGIV